MVPEWGDQGHISISVKASKLTLASQGSYIHVQLYIYE